MQWFLLSKYLIVTCPLFIPVFPSVNISIITSARASSKPSINKCVQQRITLPETIQLPALSGETEVPLVMTSTV